MWDPALGSGVFTVQGVMLFLAAHQETVLRASRKFRDVQDQGGNHAGIRRCFGMESGPGVAAGTWVLLWRSFEP